MTVLGQILQWLAGLGSLVCFILVVVQMFQRGQSTMGILCIVLLFCCGVGGLIAFIYGWVKSREWGLTNIMLVWTVCYVVSFIGIGIAPPDFQLLRGIPGM
jgi:predicted permease